MSNPQDSQRLARIENLLNRILDVLTKALEPINPTNKGTQND